MNAHKEDLDETSRADREVLDDICTTDSDEHHSLPHHEPDMHTTTFDRSLQCKHELSDVQVAIAENDIHKLQSSSLTTFTGDSNDTLSDFANERVDRETTDELEATQHSAMGEIADSNVYIATPIDDEQLTTTGPYLFSYPEARFINFLLPPGDALAASTIIAHLSSINVSNFVLNHLQSMLSNDTATLQLYSRNEAISAVIAGLLSFDLPNETQMTRTGARPTYWYEDSTQRTIGPKGHK